MKLREAILAADAGNEKLCIVARRPWTEHSECSLVQLTDDYGVPAASKSEGYDYFLEVSVIQDEFGDCWASLSDSQRIEAVIFYAENDAFPSWLNELR